MATASLSTAGVRDAAAEDPYRNRYWIAAAVTLAAVLELVDTSIVNVAVPHMMGNLGATLDEIAWVSTGYIIANVIVIPMSSWLANWFGRRRTTSPASILLFVAASFFCGAATGLWSLVFWRIVQGLGGGALLSVAQATLFEAFPPKEVGKGQAIFGMGVMVGPTLGPTLGGYIVDNLRLAVDLLHQCAARPDCRGDGVGLTCATRRMRCAQRRSTSSGIMLLATSIGSLQFMLERGERYDWFESGLVTSLAAGQRRSRWLLFIWRELTFEQPIVNLRVLKSRQLAAGVVFAAVLGLAMYGSIFVLPVFLQQLHGFTAWQTGKVIFPGAIASAFTMAIIGRNANRLDARYTIVIGVAMFGAMHVVAVQAVAGCGRRRRVLATDPARRGHGPDLRAADECQHGGTVAARRAAGHRAVQSHAAAGRVARHCDHGDAAVAVYSGLACQPRAAHERR